MCTQSHIQMYFRTGTLPPEGTVCPVIMPPFPIEVLEENYEDVNEGVVVGDSREKEMVFDVGGKLKETEGGGGGGESEMVMMMEEEMKDAVIELSKGWKPLNRPFLGGTFLL